MLENPKLYISACVASSVDGVIHPANTTGYAQLGSKRDLGRLLDLRDQTDAIAVGAETFRTFPSRYRGAQGTLPVLVVITRGQNPLQDVPLASPVFSDLAAQRVTFIVTKQLPDVATQAQYPPCVRWVFASQASPVATVVHALEGHECHTLLVEGGGEIIALFAQAQALHTLYLTLTPFLLGGGSQGARHWMEGLGFSVETAPRLSLSLWSPHETPRGTEVLTTWQLTYPEDEL
ncbi:MAG: dihydrofolate reductase family protein [Vampirovibrionales bacterium]|nr:dihydrofolate reductase family protein [Vampirovibrionales bacterium]